MTGRPLSLGRITEGLSRWQLNEVEGGLAPGIGQRGARRGIRLPFERRSLGRPEQSSGAFWATAPTI